MAMGTTAKSSLPHAAARPRQAGRAGYAFTPVALAVLMFSAPFELAKAQTRAVIVQPSVGVTVTATNNAAVDARGTPQRDVIIDLRPEVFVRARGARLTVDGTFGVNLTDYTRHSQANRASPTGRLDLSSTLLDNTLFLDAGVAGTRTPNSVFGAPVNGVSEGNASTTGSVRLSPYLLREMAPDVFVLARSDNLLANTFGGKAAVDGQGDVRHQANVVRIERRPTPAGATLEFTTDDTKYASSPDTALQQQSVRMIGKLALGADLLAGVIGGHERSTYFAQTIDANRYGLMVNWRPTERTTVEAEVEHRFFGYGWNLHARHRLPIAAFDVTMRRTASALPASLASGSASTDLAGLLDSVFTTRISNEADRSALVRDTLRSRGLDNVLPAAAADVFAQYPQSQQDVVVRAVFNSPRNTVSLSGFYAKAIALPGALPLSTTGSNDTKQYGASVDLSRRLSEDTTGIVGLERRTAGSLGSRAGDHSRQTSVQVSADKNLTPRSSAVVGLRRVVTSSSTFPAPGNVTAIFAGYRIRL